MNEAKALIKAGMAKNKVEQNYRQANLLGITPQSFSRKLDKPWTFTIFEIQKMAEMFHWSNEDLGEFIRSIKGGT